ncbi:chloride channel CLIC-like protein 1 isoform X2 [Betta splendens]|uniref:Chloride channel CLIC-like protein 1 n=2 Tax=Betta splendens TaxID=158456 RepID=A0A6P7MCL0_BETSP|nr:chloride channel CLIC-like protein 1 isoform X2 [Betta splendens]
MLVVLLCCLTLVVTGQQVDDDWVDPYDMLNYDATTKSMRKPAETANNNIVGTKRRAHTQDSGQAELESCGRQLADMQRQIEQQNKKITEISQQPSCNPVFKRFLSRLLREIQRVGSPSDSSDVFYDAKIKVSQQSMREIRTLLEGEDNWRTGALDNAISQILIDLKPHDYEAWRWRFEDTFGVEIDTLIKITLFILLVVAVICTQLWSVVSWFVQFKRLFAFCFFVSIIWNWFYLYKIAFAEHQNNMVKMDGINEKCTGVKKIDWIDNLSEWYRSTWTLQDDPCKKYHEAILVNPILLVPPTKAISVTITTFITEPLKHLGQGISEFLRALLKDLPVTLQIPVLLTIVLSILVFMYGSVQAAFQHGITAPLRRHRRDPPAPQLEEPQPPLQRIEGQAPLAVGDAPQQAQLNEANDPRLQRNQVHQRRVHRPVFVENIGNGTGAYSEDEMDAAQREAQQTDSAMSDPETQQGPAEASGGNGAVQTRTKPTESKSAQSKKKPLNVKNSSQDEASKEDAASRPQPAARRPSQNDVEDVGTSSEDKTPFESVPVQETCPVE